MVPLSRSFVWRFCDGLLLIGTHTSENKAEELDALLEEQPDKRIIYIW